MGYCILLAQPLAAALLPVLSQPHASKTAGGSGSYSSGSAGHPEAAGDGKPSRLQRARTMLAAALLVGLLLFYAGRTVLRNEDWHDEERLFVAAQKVGGASMPSSGASLLKPCAPQSSLPAEARGVACRCAGAAPRCS